MKNQNWSWYLSRENSYMSEKTVAWTHDTNLFSHSVFVVVFAFIPVPYRRCNSIAMQTDCLWHIFLAIEWFIYGWIAMHIANLPKYDGKKMNIFLSIKADDSPGLGEWQIYYYVTATRRETQRSLCWRDSCVCVILNFFEFRPRFIVVNARNS